MDAIGKPHPAVRVSVVVSTCNRSSELPRLFEALSRQTVAASLPWEVILVDNASSDDTASVIESLKGMLPCAFTHLFEPRRGKSHGLNTGIARARGDVIALTDDDGVPAADWLERLLDHFDREPQAACVGGRVVLHNPDDALITVKLDTVPATVDMHNFDPAAIPVLGCNMGLRAAALRSTGPYDVTLGPGSKAGVAEDVDMLYRLVAAGHRIDFDPRIVVGHNHGRRTREQIDQVRRGYLIGRGAFYGKYLRRRDRRVLRWMFWETRALAWNWLRSGGVTAAARAELRCAGLLCVGALRYLRHGRVSRPESIGAGAVGGQP